jgi:hypothetical protein
MCVAVKNKIYFFLIIQLTHHVIFIALPLYQRLD